MLLPLLFSAFAAPVTVDLSGTVPSRASPLVGVIAGPTSPDSPVDLTQKFHEFGIRSVRNNDFHDDRLDMEGIFNCGGSTYPSWTGCDAADDRFYNWAPSDAMMKTFKDGALEPMLRLGGESQNAGRNHDFKGPQDAAQERAWITAATKVATRYRAQYTYLDIWTEFPGPQFWDRDQPSFYSFWADAYRAVKAAVPEARVGGPGFNVFATKKMLMGERRLLVVEFLTELHAKGVRPDWIGWHIFSNDPQEYADAGKAYRRLLDGTGEYSRVPWAADGWFKGVELVLDAFGTTDRDRQEPLDAAVVYELHHGARGAAVLGAALAAIAETDTTRAYYYRANDPTAVPEGAARRGGAGAPAAGHRGPGGPGGRGGGSRGGGRGGGGGGGGGGEGGGGGDSGFTGLFDPTGAPKKAAHAFRLWNRFTAAYPTELAAAAVTGGARVVYAKGTAGTALYIANPTDAEVSLDTKGPLTLSKAAGASLWLVDATHDAPAAEPLPAGALKLPAWSVALVTLP